MNLPRFSSFSLSNPCLPQNQGKKGNNSVFRFVPWSSKLLGFVLSICRLCFVILPLVDPLLVLWSRLVVWWVLISPFPIWIFWCFSEGIWFYFLFVVHLFFSVKDAPKKYEEEPSADYAIFTNFDDRVGLIISRRKWFKLWSTFPDNDKEFFSNDTSVLIPRFTLSCSGKSLITSEAIFSVNEADAI